MRVQIRRSPGRARCHWSAQPEGLSGWCVFGPGSWCFWSAITHCCCVSLLCFGRGSEAHSWRESYQAHWAPDAHDIQTCCRSFVWLTLFVFRVIHLYCPEYYILHRACMYLYMFYCCNQSKTSHYWSWIVFGSEVSCESLVMKPDVTWCEMCPTPASARGLTTKPNVLWKPNPKERMSLIHTCSE